MRTWRNKSARDDPAAWYDVDGMIPTIRGSYKNIDYLDSGTEATATGASGTIYAWAGNGLTAAREYVVDGSHIWQYSAGAYTDRTGGVTIGSYPMMAQYGDITICVMGNATSTVSSSGGNFAALAGAPKGEIVVVQSNAVVIFNTDTSVDGWAASDVGDYTNWTTGEAASGRLIAAPGPITAACAFGNDIIVFKANSIFRMWYVGGIVKWQTALLSRGVGVQETTMSPQDAKYYACAGNEFVFFCTLFGGAGNTARAYIFDGSSSPVHVNPQTTITTGRVFFNPIENVFTIKSIDIVDSIPSPDTTTHSQYFYCASSNSWGKVTLVVSLNGGANRQPVMGDFSARSSKSSVAVLYGKLSADKLARWAPSSSNTGTCYIQTSLAGGAQFKSTFRRLTPIHTSWTTTATATLTINPAQELNDFATALSSSTAAMSSTRERFDFLVTNNFARFKISYASPGTVEIDDVVLDAVKAGMD